MYTDKQGSAEKAASSNNSVWLSLSIQGLLRKVSRQRSATSRIGGVGGPAP